MKKKLILIPLLFTSLLSACVLYNGDPNHGKNESDSAIKEITTSVDSLEFNKGDLAKEVTATLKGDGEFDTTLKVVSNDENIVTVQSKGDKFESKVAFTVTPIAPGNTELIISSVEKTSVKATISVVVNDKEGVIPVNGVTLNKTSLELIIGNSETLTHTIDPQNATNTKVTWSTSDEKVATVDQNGKVTGVAKGTTQITVTSEDGQKSAICEVTVINNPEVTEGYYLVGTMTDWKANADYKMQPNPKNPDEMMITWLAKKNDQVKVIYKPAVGDYQWKQINSSDSGSQNGCATIEGDNFKLGSNATYTLYFLINPIGDTGTYKYWFNYSL